MEFDSMLQKITELIYIVRGSIWTTLQKFKEKVLDVLNKTKKIGQDDPRRITHSTKVGLALTIVSLLYYFRPLYDGFGQSGMWAILTVVLVFEFTVGGTLSKCLNRGFATVIAASLGIGSEYMASLCGGKGKPIILGFFVFCLAAASTFIRFFPQIKRRYDYGVLVFILTFSMVTVSGYRVEQIFGLAHDRISTILIGAVICMIISISFCPVRAGEDLHKLVISNIEKLANFLEGMGDEFFLPISPDVKSFSQAYSSVLNTKATEEYLGIVPESNAYYIHSQANLAWWEPSHGGFSFFHPWKQYLKIGVLTRECAFQFEALNSCSKSESKVLLNIFLHEKVIMMSSKAGKALKELASAIKAMKHPSSSAIETHVQNSKSAVDELIRVLETLPLNKTDGMVEIIQAAAITSILIEIIKCIERISESAHELSKQANFKNCTTIQNQQENKTDHGNVKLVNDVDCDHVIISTVE